LLYNRNIISEILNFFAVFINNHVRKYIQIYNMDWFQMTRVKSHRLQGNMAVCFDVLKKRPSS
jgi:hypothetical protein